MVDNKNRLTQLKTYFYNLTKTALNKNKVKSNN